MEHGNISKIRNIGIIAHIDAGKTTTTEMILYHGGRIHTLGTVDEGTTTTDWYRLEREMGISIFSAVTTIYWNDHQINIIDTPGHIDFTAEVERSLRVLDGAIVVFCGVAGVQAQSETVWRQADKYKLPRIVYINKLDRIGSSYDRTFNNITTKLGCALAPITIPIVREEVITGVIDLLRTTAYRFSENDKGATVTAGEIDSEDLAYFKRWKEALIDCVSKYDDNVLSCVINGVDISADNLTDSIRKLVLANKVIPVYAGASLKYIGIQPLIDGITAFLPSPLDRRCITAKVYDGKQNTTIDLASEREPILYAFKTFSDLHSTITYARIYSGRVQKGIKLRNTRANKDERIGNILKVHANETTPSAYAERGDIIAISNLKYTKTGDTLVGNKHVVLEDISFPTTVVSVSIEPKLSSDRDKLAQVLERLSLDDPTFKFTFDTETNQTLVSGMGELHLQIIARRIQEDFKVHVKTGRPMVAYKETILRKTRAKYEYSSKMHDQPVYGGLELELIPCRDNFYPVVEFDIANSNLDPKIGRELDKYKDSIAASVTGALQSGELMGYQVIYAKCIIKAIYYNEVSNEVAYSIAANNAIRHALKGAEMTLLEPYMKVSISIQEEHIGSVVNDLNARNVIISELSKQQGECVIYGIAPLSEMFGFADSLRSKTQGRGTFIMEPFEYREIPKDKQRKMLGVFNQE